MCKIGQSILTPDCHFLHTKGKIEIKKIDIKENHANVLTKSILKIKFMYCLDLLNAIFW